VRGFSLTAALQRGARGALSVFTPSMPILPLLHCGLAVSGLGELLLHPCYVASAG
jgi:hypothetical protein